MNVVEEGKINAGSGTVQKVRSSHQPPQGNSVRMNSLECGGADVTRWARLLFVTGGALENGVLWG